MSESARETAMSKLGGMLFEVKTATPPPNNTQLDPNPNPTFAILETESHSAIPNPKPQTSYPTSGGRASAHTPVAVQDQGRWLV
jgi:hypothetical protein